MARLVAACALGVVIGVVVGAAHQSHGDTDGDDSTTPSAATVAVAEKAGVDALDLLGASHSTGLEPEQYLIAVGELAPPGPPTAARSAPQAGAAVAPAVDLAPPQGWPIGGALGARIYCVESVESHHGAAMGPNPIGVWNAKLGVYEHAVGWLGWLPSTAAQWGVQIGNRASEWRGAARIFAQGERFARTQFYGVGAGIC